MKFHVRQFVLPVVLPILLACSGPGPSPAAPSVAVTIQGPSTLETDKSAAFTATVTGSSNTSVTWTCTGGSISPSGAYTAPASPGQISVTATSVADTTKNAQLVVTVTQGNRPPGAPTITGPTKVTAGIPATFALAATDPDGDSVSFTTTSVGATIQASTLTLVAPSNFAGSSMTLQVLATDSKGLASSNGTLIVNVLAPVPAPVITRQPTNQTVFEGTNIQFSVEATGQGTLTYQWFRNGNAILFANASTILLSAALSENQTRFSVRVSNAGGSILSQEAVLTVTAVGAGQWKLIPGSSPARFGPRSELLPDGRVLLFGGLKVSIQGHSYEELDIYERSIVVFDPQSQANSTVGTFPRYTTGGESLHHQASGKIYSFGGNGPSSDLTLGRDVFRIDPTTFAVAVVGQLGQRRINPVVATLASGRILVAGGRSEEQNNAPILASFEVFDPISNTVTASGSLPVPVVAVGYGSTAQLATGQLFLVANDINPQLNANSIASEKTLVFTESGNTVQVALGPNLSGARYNTSTILLGDGRVAVVGGRNAARNAVGTVDIFNSTGTQLVATFGLGTPRSTPQLALFPGGWIFVAAGFNDAGQGLLSSMFLNVQSGAVLSTGQMNTARQGAKVVLLPGNKPFIFGGIDNAGAVLGTGEVYE